MTEPAFDPWMEAVEIRAAYAAGTLSPVTVMAGVLARAEALNPKINALFHIRAEAAMAEAEASAARWKAGAPIGPLDGIPVSIKDSVAAEGMPYWRGVKARIGEVSAADSPPAARLREAGAILWAKTTMPDFGLLGASVSSAHGVTRNPYDLGATTGGSSAGAAASVAAGIGPLSVGSDLGGSVRLPAAHCGLVGLKPGRGVVPHLPFSAMRVAGPLARSARDAALLASVLAVSDPRLPRSAGLPQTPPAVSIPGRRLGYLPDIGGMAPDAQTRAALDAAAGIFADAGAQIIPMDPVLEPADIDAMALFFAPKGALELAAIPEDRRDGVLPFIRRFTEAGLSVPATEHILREDRLERAAARLEALALSVDQILMPVMPVPSFPAEAVGLDPESPHAHIAFTLPANLLGWPAVSAPCALSAAGLPIGLQILGRPGEDALLLGLAAAWEALSGFSARPDI